MLFEASYLHPHATLLPGWPRVVCTYSAFSRRPLSTASRPTPETSTGFQPGPEWVEKGNVSAFVAGQQARSVVHPDHERLRARRHFLEEMHVRGLVPLVTTTRRAWAPS